MQIRLANTADSERVSALAIQTYTDAFGHSFSPADLVAHLKNNLSVEHFERMLAQDTILVAELGTRLVGFVQFGPGNFEAGASGGNDPELRRLYVLPDCQNKGIGALLMRAALEHPSLMQAERVYLDVWEHKLGAQRFYARHGFVVVSKRRFITESGAEGDLDLIMVRLNGAEKL